MVEEKATRSRTPSPVGVCLISMGVALREEGVDLARNGWVTYARDTGARFSDATHSAGG